MVLQPILARATTGYLNANNVKVIDFSPKSPDLNIIENILDELNRHVRRKGGYSDHTESTESKISLLVEQPPSELRSALCEVNDTSLSEQCGGHTHY